MASENVNEVGIEIKTDGIRQAVSDIDKLTDALENLNEALEDSGKGGKGLQEHLEKMLGEYYDYRKKATNSNFLNPNGDSKVFTHGGRDLQRQIDDMLGIGRKSVIDPKDAGKLFVDNGIGARDDEVLRDQWEALKAQEAERQRLLEIETRSLQLKEQMLERERQERDAAREAAQQAQLEESIRRAERRSQLRDLREQNNARERAIREQQRQAERQARDEARDAERQAREVARQQAEYRARLRDTVSMVAGGAKNMALFVGKKALNGLASLGKAITSPLRKAQQLFDAVKRIAFYRAIRTLLKELVEGFSTGVKNLYEWSRLNDGVFKASMDSLATSMLYLKNSIGAMAAPIISYLIPVINAAIDKFVEFINVVNQALAALTGQNFWYKATKQATEYEKAASGASNATKKQLMAFDELNNISKNSGGGGGSSQADYSGMFTKETLDWTSKSLADLINEAVQKIDEMRIGLAIGDKINGALKKIHEFLSGINFDNIGITLANIINDSAKKIRGSDIGLVIADVLNAAIHAAYGFISTIDAVELATDFASAVNGILTNTDWKLAGKTVSEFANKLYTFIKTAVQKIDKKKVLKAFTDFFSGLEFGKIFAPITDLYHALTDGVAGTFELIKALWDGHIEDLSPRAKKVWDKYYSINTVLDIVGGAVSIFVDNTAMAIGEWAQTCVSILGDFVLTVGKIGVAFIDAALGVMSGKLTITEALEQIKTQSGIYMEEFKTGVSTRMEETRSTIASKSQSIVEYINNIFEALRRAREQRSIDIEVSIKAKADQYSKQALELLEGGSVNVSAHSVKGYASGGFPSQGSLFLAGETTGEAEMVGTINGRTGVASGREITGIADAVYSTGADESKLLQEQNQLLRALLNKQLTIAPSAGLGQVNARSATMYNRVTGA